MASKKTIEVLKLYRKGCNCFQAVALPFCDELSLDKLTVVQSFSGFDHSVIGDSAVCGALLGALYVVSLKCRVTIRQKAARRRSWFAESLPMPLKRKWAAIYAAAKRNRSATGQ